MKREKLTSILWFVAGAGFSLAGIFGDSFIFIVFGCCFATFGVTHWNKSTESVLAQENRKDCLILKNDGNWTVSNNNLNGELLEIDGIIIYVIIKDFIQIDTFAVRSKYRKQGYGHSAITLLKNHVKDFKNISHIKVYPRYEDYFKENVELTSRTLYKIYQQLGFEFAKEKCDLDVWNNEMILKI